MYTFHWSHWWFNQWPHILALLASSVQQTGQSDVCCFQSSPCKTLCMIFHDLSSPTCLGDINALDDLGSHMLIIRESLSVWVPGWMCGTQCLQPNLMPTLIHFSHGKALKFQDSSTVTTTKTNTLRHVKCTREVEQRLDEWGTTPGGGSFWN